LIKQIQAHADFKGAQGGKDEAAQTVQKVRQAVEDEANTVIV